MDVIEISINEIRLNKANPRTIRDNRFGKLIESILTFPDMLRVRPIVVSKDMTCLGGNMRARVLAHLAEQGEGETIRRLKSSRGFSKRTPEEQEWLVNYWERWFDKPTAPVVVAAAFTDRQSQEFIIKDNADFGEWDWDILANAWDAEDLDDWGLDLPQDLTINPDNYGEDFSLKNGDKENCQTMTFILSNEQLEFIKNALAKIKKQPEFSQIENFDNKNSNGNALYALVVQWDEQKK